MKFSFLAKSLSWAAIVLAVLSAPALAQTTLISSPAEKLMVSPGGVDLRTGQFAYNETDLSIGGESGGLTLTRTSVQAMSGYANPFATFSHNWDVMIQELRVDRDNPREGGSSYRMLVQFGGRSRSFDLQFGSGYVTYNKSGDGPMALLNYSGALDSAGVVYTYTASDGTVVVFHALGNGDCAPARCAYAGSVTEADGTRYTLSYASTGLADGALRLSRVVSSRGYALLLEGSGHQVNKACVLNLALTTLPSTDICPAGAQATSTYTYVTAGLATATGADNATSSFTYSASTMGFIRPGETTPWLVNTHGAPFDYSSYVPYGVHRQDLADGQSYTYGIQYGPAINPGWIYPSIGSGYSAAHGGGVVALYDWIRRPGYNQPGEPCVNPPCQNEQPLDYDGGDPRIVFQQTPGPVEIRQPLGRTTVFDYCDPVAMAGLPANLTYRCFVGPLASFTTPDGIRTELEYDAMRNVTKVTRIARPGSVQPNGQPWPNLVSTAAFDTTNIRSQTKPLWVTDARGNTTNYTYSVDHGGVLTETGPAPTAGAPRPQTRHAYAQRRAWISNGTGGYVQATTPVWVRTSTSMCRTSAATGNPCATAGDEVLTQYDYGPDSGPNTLLLRGQTVTSTDMVAGSPVTTTLRTCYGYDALGRRISETQPNANLASCP